MNFLSRSFWDRLLDGRSSRVSPAKSFRIHTASGGFADQAIPQGYLAAVLIVRNEARYMREWLEFHFAAGVEHVFIYDNHSTDDLHERVEPYISAGRVSIIPWPHFLDGFSTQCLAYGHAIACLRTRFTWVAFLDADEFLFPVAEQSLPEVLLTYEDVPALGVYWRNFGTSGIVDPQPLVLDNYVMRQKVGQGPEGTTITNFKSIVQPKLVTGVISAHAFETSISPVLALDEKRCPITGGEHRNVTSDRLRINHYFTRSMTEWQQKLTANSVRSPEYSNEDKRRKLYDLFTSAEEEDKLIVKIRDRLVAGQKRQASEISLVSKIL